MSRKVVSIPQFLEVDGIEQNYKNEVPLLLEEALDLRERLNDKIEDEDYDPEIHIAKRYKEVKASLAAIQSEYGLEGVRYNDIVFKARLQTGKKSLDQDLLIKELLSAGVMAGVIEKAIKTATKQGESYWIHEIREVKETA